MPSCHFFQPLRYELVSTPLRLHRPIWREDADLDLDYHLRRVQVPAPGGRRELDAVIGAIASEPLDRRRPLWQFHYAEGLSDNRIAVIGKVHHVLADGVASANLLARAMEWPGGEAPHDQIAEASPAANDTRCPAIRGTRPRSRFRSLPSAVRDGVVGGYRLQRRARQRRRDPELAARFKPPPTFFNRKPTAARTFASATLPLADVKAISKKLDVTINDLVLTTVAGALRRLLLMYGEDADAAAHRLGARNYRHLAGPDRRQCAGHDAGLVACSHRRSDGAASVDPHVDTHREGRSSTPGPHPGGPVAGVRAADTHAHSLSLDVTKREAPNKLFNLIVSNVPGPREYGRIAGAVVTEFYSVGPLAAGAALNVTVWSYVDQLSVSVISDDDTSTTHMK